MCRINNYYCINEMGNVCSITSNGQRFLRGIADDTPDTVTQTKKILKIEGGVAYTVDGPEYELGTKNKELEELEKAIKDGTPVLKDWHLTRIPTGRFVMCGHVNDGKDIAEVVVSQDGNFVTLANGITYLVIWANANFSYEQKKKMKKDGVFCGLRFPVEFDKTWLSFGIRPRIPALG